VAQLSKKIIAPGHMATLKVDLDTSLKLGRVEKLITLTTNDPKHPQFPLTLWATVDPNFMGHEKIAVKNRLVLFQGKCASCHVAKGVGKSGESLFNADCAMCHGVAGQGRVAPSLIVKFKGNPDARYHDPAFRAHFKEIITSGAPNNPSMPPFGEMHGGPLSDSQIDSLLTYLSYLAETTEQE
jgi:mono/diheme cytochrome c family protein